MINCSFYYVYFKNQVLLVWLVLLDEGFPQSRLFHQILPSDIYVDF